MRTTSSSSSFFYSFHKKFHRHYHLWTLTTPRVGFEPTTLHLYGIALPDLFSVFKVPAGKCITLSIHSVPPPRRRTYGRFIVNLLLYGESIRGNILFFFPKCPFSSKVHWNSAVFYKRSADWYCHASSHLEFITYAIDTFYIIGYIGGQSLIFSANYSHGC